MFSRLTTSFLLWMVLVLTVVFLETSAASDKVLLRDVSTITLHKGKMTTGRRVSPTMQLKCVGGSAKGAYTPKVVQCSNQGFDGSDVQWRCDADLPHDMEFGALSVSCEGYDYADDPYILKGSCGLEYELEYNSGSGNRSVSRKSSEDRWDQFATFVVVAFIAYIIYAMWTNRNQNPVNNGYRAGGGGGPGGPGSGGGGGPGGYPSAPPPYDDNYGKPPPYGFRGDSQSSQSGGGCQGSSNQGTTGGANQNGGGSFWSGATLGAIGGYLANSYLNSNNAYARPRYNRGFFQDTGFSSSDSWSSPSTSSTRSSSGYGGTTRR